MKNTIKKYPIKTFPGSHQKFRALSDNLEF